MKSETVLERFVRAAVRGRCEVEVRRRGFVTALEIRDKGALVAKFRSVRVPGPEGGRVDEF